MRSRSSWSELRGAPIAVAAIDQVDERPEDRAPAQPANTKISPRRVRRRQQRIGRTLMNNRRIMKFVPAKASAGRPERPAGEKGRAAIAEMEASVGKARHQRQQPSHALSAPLGVDQIFAEHHVAAAFAIDRFPASRGAVQARGKSLGGAKRACPKLWIAAR